MAFEDDEKALSLSQREKIKRYLRDRGSLNRALGSSMTNRRRSPAARLTVQGRTDLAAAVQQTMQSMRAQTHQTLCNQFDWCKNKGAKLYQMMVSAVKILLPLFSGKAAAIANIVFMVQEYMFDQLCECPKA